MEPVLLSKPSRVAAAGTKPKLIDEYTLVLKGMLRVEYRDGDTISAMDVHAGQAVITARGQWVRYSTPDASGAEYVAICHPAFTLEAAHRDDA